MYLNLLEYNLAAGNNEESLNYAYNQFAMNQQLVLHRIWLKNHWNISVD